jgi:hypothetical protein
MATLAAQRPVFHSEADFQHAFAWEIHRQIPSAIIRLERPITTADSSLHLDFFVETTDQAIAVELKYKTRKLQVEVGGERYRIASHGAQVLGRYDFMKDVCRLESIGNHLPGVEGWAIFLTNDSAYWKQHAEKEMVDERFRIFEGRNLCGSLAWGDHASLGTKKGREKTLEISGSYPLAWKNYSTPTNAAGGQFRYLAIRVP